MIADGRHPGGQAADADDARADDARTSASDAQRRAEIRRFVLAHHPDRGGDPAVFDAGLRALRARSRADPAGVGRPPYVTVYRKRAPAAILADWVARHWKWKRPGRQEHPARVR